MKRLLLRWILMAVSVVAASLICRSLGLGFEVEALKDSNVQAGEILELFLGVAILSLLNATLRPILKFLTLPLNCLTLGLFSLVINALVLWIAASLNIGYTIEDTGLKAFLAAFIGSILISAISGVLGVFIPDDKDE